MLLLPAPAYGLPAGLNDLGTLGGDHSSGEAINNSGTVVGKASPQAFVWQNGVMEALDDLVPVDTGFVSIDDINESGQILARLDDLSFSVVILTPTGVAP